MKIAQIKVDKTLQNRVLKAISSLKPDEVLTSSELTEKLNLTSLNGRLSRILSSLNRKSVVVEGRRQWVYGTDEGFQNLEKQFQGSNENL